MPKVKGTPAVRFTLESEKDPKRPTPIRLYFHYRGQRLKYVTGEKIAPKFWDKTKQRAKQTYPEAVDFNIRLNDIEKATVKIYTETNRGQIEPAAFRAQLDYRLGFTDSPEAITPVSLLKFISLYVEEKRTTAPRSTYASIKSKIAPLVAFAEERAPRLDYKDITHAFFNEFKAWLFSAPREYSVNHVGKIMGVVKQIMRDAERRGYHSKTDYQAFSIKPVKMVKFVLDFTELEALYHLDLTGNPRLEKVRDLFLIGAYTGLRFSDFSRIQPEHVAAVEGQTLLTITTQKTAQTVTIPLFEIPLTLLKKYDFQAPVISNQKMNDYLKELGQVAGLTDKVLTINTTGGTRKQESREKWELLTTHVARRSFATNFYRKGVPAIVLMQITGHTTEGQFMNYISIRGKENALHFAELHKDKTAPLAKVAG